MEEELFAHFFSKLNSQTFFCPVSLVSYRTLGMATNSVWTPHLLDYRAKAVDLFLCIGFLNLGDRNGVNLS